MISFRSGAVSTLAVLALAAPLAALAQGDPGVVASPEVRQPLEADGWVPFDATPAAFDGFVRAETQRWTAAIRAAGIRIDP